MANDVQVVVVSAGSPSESLIEALKARGLVVHACGFADAEEEIDENAPDLVILTGVRGAMELTTMLDDDTRKIRPRVAIVARSRELTQLRGLNRQLVVSVLTQELGDRMVSERLDTLARKWAKVRDDSPGREPLPTLDTSSLFPGGLSNLPPAGVTEPPLVLNAPVAPEPKIEAPKPATVALGDSSFASLPPSVPEPSVGNRVSHPNFEALADKALGMLDALDTGMRKVDPSIAEAKEVAVPKAPEAPSPPKGEPEAAKPPAQIGRVQLTSKAAEVPRVTSPLNSRSPTTPAVKPIDFAGAIRPDASPPVAAKNDQAPSLVLDSSSLLESVPPESLDDLEMVDADSIRPPALPKEAFEDLHPPTPAVPMNLTPIDESLHDEPTKKGSVLDLLADDPALGSTVAVGPADQALFAAALEEETARINRLKEQAPVPESFAPAIEEPLFEKPVRGLPESRRPAPPKKSGGGIAIVIGLLAVAGGLAYYQFIHSPSVSPKKETTPAAKPATKPAAAAPTAQPSSEQPTAQPSAPPEASAAAPDTAAPAVSAPPEASAAPSAIPAPAPAAPPSTPRLSIAGDPYRVEEAKVPSCSELVPTPPEGGIDPKHQASVFWKDARAFIVRGEIAKANLAMCQAAALQADTPALEGLAMIYLTQNAPTQALSWVEKAEAARPGVRETVTLHADILSFLGKPEEALSMWLLALNIQPDETGRRRGVATEDTTLGRSFMKQGDLPRAERLLRRAAALDPTNAVAAASLAEVMKKRGHRPGAAFFAARSLEVFPMNPDAELILGDLNLESGDRVSAKAHYEKALAIRSDFWAAKMKLKELENP